MTKKYGLLRSIIAASSLQCTIGYALDYDVNAVVAVEHSDNANLDNDQQRSDIEQRTELGLHLQQDSQHVQAAVDYRVLNSDYMNNVLDDDTRLEGQANVKWSPIPGSIDWNLFTSTYNLQRDSSQADILNNREGRTIISTGPSLNARLSSIDTLSIGAYYTSTELEDTNQSDNKRASGHIDWTHRLSPNREFSTGLQYSNTDFELINQPDIKSSSAYIAFGSTLSSSHIRLKLGYNQSKRDSLDDVSGPLVEFAMNYRPVNQEISFIAINLITDSTIGLGINSTLVEEGVGIDDSNFDNIDIVERLYSRLRYTNTALCNVCTITASVVYDEEDFETQVRDEQSLETELGFQYRLSSSLNAGILLEHETIDFENGDRNDDVNSVTLRTSYSATESMTLFAAISFEERSSNAEDFNYDELRGEIGVRYQFY